MLSFFSIKINKPLPTTAQCFMNQIRVYNLTVAPTPVQCFLGQMRVQTLTVAVATNQKPDHI